MMFKRKRALARRGCERGRPVPAFRAWLRKRHCAACWSVPPSDAAHFPRVKQHGDRKNMIPLCRRCHRQQHAEGVTSFAARWQLDQVTANDFWSAFVSETGYEDR
jgi:hypothetical protein